MKTTRILVAVALLAFVAGFFAACSIGFDPTDGTNQFSCTTDADCISPNECRGGVCQRRDSINCTDDDGDGYGVGETGGCPECQSNNKCAEDCNDNDEAINPGLVDNCDGKDNNCNDEIDEAVPCEDSFDCPDENPYLSSCVNSVCVYKPPVQIGAECTSEVACVGGMREDRPDACF